MPPTFGFRGMGFKQLDFLRNSCYFDILDIIMSCSDMLNRMQ